VIAREELESIGERVLTEVRRAQPGAEALVRVTSWATANVRFAQGMVQSCGDVDEREVRLRVVLGQRHAYIVSDQVDLESLRGLAERAVAMARLAPEDPEAMPLLGQPTFAPGPSGFDSALAGMADDGRAAAARVAMAATKQAGLHEAGYFENDAERYVLMNTAGLRLGHEDTYAEMTVTARTPDGKGSGWGVTASHRAAEVDAAAATRAACDKATRSVGARPLEPGKYTVVLEPAAVGDLLGFLAEPLEARAVDEGRSALGKPGGGSRLGEKIASELVTLVSDPADPELPVAPFDDDGLPRKLVRWIDRGVLTSLAYSRYWAKKQGKEPTPTVGWHLLGGSAASVDELVAGVKRGLLVTRFFYTRDLDPQLALVTGLTRDGLFLIEEGKIVAPVNNFRWNESPIHMLAKCDALTKATWRVDRFSRVPALRTAEFNMASLSEAV
jgi:predicted Zn-dependent protease